ncbi:MAG: HemK family protein methyltransferase, partial [Alphaproteobacteria bacterium]|nr:HemK family protein methyltransferase [Alphaproteobacteria bacterium]
MQTALDRAAARLAAAGVENPRLEARLLLAQALGVDQERLLRERGAAVDAGGVPPLLERRAAGEPLAYILGRREFWGLAFAVAPAALVPRPDSETLIEAALAALPDRARVGAVLDLGTGSGCLLLALLSELPNATGIGVEIAAGAAATARRNARALGLADRARFVVGDWGTAMAGRFDAIVAN